VRRPAESKKLAILDLASKGYLPAQIAGEAEVSRQYVHTVLGGLVAGLLRERPERQADLRRSYHRALSALQGHRRHRRPRQRSQT
jgi:hypothetical protein